MTIPLDFHFLERSIRQSRHLFYLHVLSGYPLFCSESSLTYFFFHSIVRERVTNYGHFVPVTPVVLHTLRSKSDFTSFRLIVPFRCSILLVPYFVVFTVPTSTSCVSSKFRFLFAFQINISSFNLSLKLNSCVSSRFHG